MARMSPEEQTSAGRVTPLSEGDDVTGAEGDRADGAVSTRPLALCQVSNPR